MTLVAVLDYGIGNLRSAQKALEHVGADARLTADPGLVREASAVVLPGVGSFGRCLEALRDRGLDELATEAARGGRPFLGVCVGMQMLYEWSEEAPGVPGLGVLPGGVVQLPATVKRPQMQWNLLRPGSRSVDSTLWASLPDPAWVYFVHSYAPEPGEHVVATCDYGGPVTAAVEQGGVWATQFHPEKSGRVGMALLRSFVTRAALARAA